VRLGILGIELDRLVENGDGILGAPVGVEGLAQAAWAAASPDSNSSALRSTAIASSNWPISVKATPSCA